MIDVRFAPGVVACCVKCGTALDRLSANTCALSGFPPACDDCFYEVEEQLDADVSMWPSDWYGHAYTDPEGKWIIMQEDND